MYNLSSCISVVILAQANFWLRYGSLPLTLTLLTLTLDWTGRMAPAAPVVLRCGTLIAHINDVGSLQATAEALVRCGVGGTMSQSVAIAAHEEALSVARSLGFSCSEGAVASQLRDAGLPALAKRVRASGRACGLAAHPDTTLAEDLAVLPRRAPRDAGPTRNAPDPLELHDPWLAGPSARRAPEAPRHARNTNQDA